MKPIKQTIFGEGKGNCLSACIASILELKIEEVPVFISSDWWNDLQKWLQSKGYFAIDIEAKNKEGYCNFYEVPKGLYVILTGDSPRGDFLHCVVGIIDYDNNKMIANYIHDPHPDNSFLKNIQRIKFIVKPI